MFVQSHLTPLICSPVGPVIRLSRFGTRTRVSSLTGLGDEVYAVAFDSNHMLSGSNDKTIKLWDKNSGVLSRTLIGHGELVYLVSFDFTY